MAIAAPLSIDIASRHQVYLEGLKTQDSKKVQKFIRDLDVEIRHRLSQDITEFTRARLERMLATVRKDVQKISKQFIRELKEDINDLAEYEAGFEVRSLAQVVEYDFELPLANQLKAAVFTNPLDAPGPDGENLLDSFLDGISTRTQNRVANAIRLGYYQGETTNQILRRVRGTRENGFRDGILSRLDTDARTVVRTALQHASAQARQETWRNNSDIVKGYRWVSTLDSRTSAQCRSLDGQTFPIDKGPKPPIHPNCRSTTVAVLDERFKSLREGATRFSREESGVEYIPAKTTYYQWLKNQPAGFQDSVLGVTRGKLLRQGGLSAQRFAELQLGKTFRPLTLAQMRELEPVAFTRAGI